MTGGLSNYGTINSYSSEPYCSVASFRSAPTWLDSNDLIPGGTSSKQDNELYNVLLRATSWCDIVTGGATEHPYLGASLVTQNERIRANRWGELSIHPWQTPVQYVASIETGSAPQTLTPVPNITQLWIEDNRQIIIPLAGGAQFIGLQFGAATVPGGMVYVSTQYAAGYFNSTLAAGTYNAGSTSVTVVNPVGLIPGTVFRINDPGSEEVVTVASSYVPGTALVPLVGTLLYTHTAPAATSPGTMVGVSAMPLGIEQACISYAVGLLLREDTSGQKPFAGTPFGPSTRKAAAGGKAAGLISDAEGFLYPFRRIR